MRVAHAHQIGVVVDARRERAQHVVEPRDDLIERNPHPERLDVVLDIHRGRAEVQLAASDRCLAREHANLGHEIVADLALDRERRRQINVLGMCAQVVEFGVADEPGALLRFRERHPDRAPQLASLAFGEELSQRRARVAP